ncbi:MAG: hypothetical protein WDZ35_09600 [Crocinitomicaceae bacterium]
MDTIFSIYNKLIIKEVTYEMGDNFVTASCELEGGDKPKVTKIRMTHTDLNRIIAKIAALGYEFRIENVNHFKFNDGTQIVDYKFENVFGESIVLENFHFQQNIKQIRA